MATLLKVLNNLADIKSAGGVALRVRTQGLLRCDLRRLALKDDLLGGRYGYRPGLHRLRDHPQEVDLQKPVLQAGALDLDTVGELEVAFEIPLGNALVDQVALLLTAALLVAADR